MAIIGALPITLTNGTVADATQVMQDFSFIVSQVNNNGAELSLTPQLNVANVFTQPQTALPATTRAHLPRASQVQDGAFNYLTGVAGTNAVTGNAAISPGAYIIGAAFWFIPAATNTGATTLSINGLGAQAVQVSGNGCTGGELRAGKPVGVFWSGAAFQIVHGCWGGGRPLASYVQIAGATTPADVLLCFGQSIATAGAGADLFARIGYTYGGAGASFTLPDCRGRTVVGKDDMGGGAAGRVTAGVSGVNGAALGGAGGDQQAQTHTHTFTASASPSGSHSHTTNIQSFSSGFNAQSVTLQPAQFGAPASFTSSTQPDHTHTISASGGTALSGVAQNMQPSIIANTGIVW